MSKKNTVKVTAMDLQPGDIIELPCRFHVDYIYDRDDAVSPKSVRSIGMTVQGLYFYHGVRLTCTTRNDQKIERILKGKRSWFQRLKDWWNGAS